MSGRSSFLAVVLVVFAIAAHSLLARDEEELAKPPKIDAAYVAPAYMRAFFLDVQAMEPRWLYEKQIEKWFPIESSAFRIAHVTAEPVAIPAKMKKRMFEVLSNGTKGTKEEFEKGPFLGPDRAYVIFDSERDASLIVYRQFGMLTTQRARSVSDDDMYQPVGSWVTFSDAKDIVKFLESIDPPAKEATKNLKN